MLKIQHLTKMYGNKKAVDDLSLHICPGEIYGFIGHNGAGKTTTLKSVVGILQFEFGEILIDGKSIVKNPLECKREIAYIPDNPDLYDYMTGIKYLNFVSDIYGINEKDRNELIHKYSDIFEITGDLAQPIAAYSHGMKQKLAIISAWIHSPKLIIMDEPFVGLDPKASHLLKGMMREVCDNGGAIFFSTHVLEVAEKLCDKIAIIKAMDEPFVGLDPKASHLLKGMMREVCDNGGAIFFSTHVLEVAEKLCDKIAIIKGGKLIRSGTVEEVKGDDSLEEVFLELEVE